MVGTDCDASAANNDRAIFAELPLWDNFPTLTLCRDFTNIIFQNVIVFIAVFKNNDILKYYICKVATEGQCGKIVTKR